MKYVMHWVMNRVILAWIRFLDWRPFLWKMQDKHNEHHCLLETTALETSSLMLPIRSQRRIHVWGHVTRYIFLVSRVSCYRESDRLCVLCNDTPAQSNSRFRRMCKDCHKVIVLNCILFLGLPVMAYSHIFHAKAKLHSFSLGQFS